jgi:membrane-bound lytic murein transglycosylase D
LITNYFHFETFAKLTGTCMEEMQKLNPAFHRNAIPEGKTMTIKVPLVAKQVLDSNRAFILDSASKVGKGQLGQFIDNQYGNVAGRELISYKVKSGEALGSIANRYSVRVEDIKSWNNLSSNLIHPGKKLSIWVVATKKTVKADSTKANAIFMTDGKTYTVQPGDTLWDISKKFDGLTIEKIKALNKMKTAKLQPGQKLIVG